MTNYEKIIGMPATTMAELLNDDNILKLRCCKRHCYYFDEKPTQCEYLECTNATLRWLEDKAGSWYSDSWYDWS